MIVVEKNIPMPPQGSGRPTKYPWRDMQPGDSFFVPGETVQSFAGNLSSRLRNHGEQYRSRTEGDGVRVWRVS